MDAQQIEWMKKNTVTVGRYIHGSMSWHGRCSQRAASEEELIRLWSEGTDQFGDWFLKGLERGSADGMFGRDQAPPSERMKRRTRGLRQRAFQTRK